MCTLTHLYAFFRLLQGCHTRERASYAHTHTHTHMQCTLILQGRHTRERASYEAVSAGYETTTLALEKEADAVQEQAVSLENKLGVLRVEVSSDANICWE